MELIGTFPLSPWYSAIVPWHSFIVVYIDRSNNMSISGVRTLSLVSSEIRLHDTCDWHSFIVGVLYMSISSWYTFFVSWHLFIVVCIDCSINMSLCGVRTLLGLSQIRSWYLRLAFVHWWCVLHIYFFVVFVLCFVAFVCCCMHWS
jgi:hypothetical protein